MPRFTDLNDSDDFPTWDHLPAEQHLDPVYQTANGGGRQGTGHRHVPKRHWCFLAEIQSFDLFMRYRTVVKDENDEEMIVAFYLDNDKRDDFNPGKLHEGHTMAIMYAHQRMFLDGTYGVRVERPEHVRIFPLSLQELQWLSTDVQEYGKDIDGQRKCHGCDKIADSPSLDRCSRCKTFCYCDKDCQVKGWIEKHHKKTCKVLKDIGFQSMLNLDFSTYEGPLSFPKD